VLRQLFPGGDKSISRYVELLSSVGVVRGLIGPQEAPRIWERHVLNCAVVAPVFAAGSMVCDLGSGAGLPGVVVALARPDLHVTLLEPLLRRVRFLEDVKRTLGLGNVAVLRGRAEDVHGQHRFDYVTARAVAPVDRLARWALPLCRPGGEVVALKGASAADELNRHAQLLARLTSGRVWIEQYGVGIVSPPTTVIRIERAGHPDAQEDAP
jgi:16S rRNA (guanine527-N7)-methyltransferase